MEVSEVLYPNWNAVTLTLNGKYSLLNLIRLDKHNLNFAN